jgi:hypothetical protein
MDFKQAVAAIAACTILSGLPAVVLASTAGSNDPIVVSAVEATPPNVVDGSGPGDVSVAFKNTAAVPATEVTFEFNVNGANADRFDDVGTFAPGVTINHTFLTEAGGSDWQLRIAKVTFADGTSWVNGSVQ